MKAIILPVIAIVYASLTFAQNTFKAIVKDSLTNTSLIGSTAVLKGTTNGSSVDINGKVEIKNIPNGSQTIIFNFIGYENLELTFIFPLTDSLKEQLIFMKSEAEEMEEVIVSTTRTSRTIQNTPTRVETIEAEEIDEKSNMRPSNVSMILHESTGIQVQQTSATSGNASIRIQGLDGRYTQLLKDGHPNFGNFASGLSILEIPPLDLQQVEIIKGPVSTLYGGGAIAGVVNFISKTPKEKAEYKFILNQSHIGQTNVGLFASQQKNKFGYTILGLANKQQPYDVDKDDFTELPQSIDFTIHPKLFSCPSEKLTLMLGNSFTTGERTGGDIIAIKNSSDTSHAYFESNKTLRNNTAVELNLKVKEQNKLTAKSSFSCFNRDISLSDYDFKGTNYNSFSDLSFIHNKENQTLIVGVNFVHDNFFERDTLNFPGRDFKSNSGGLYMQHTWDISKKIKLENGLRAEIINYSNLNYSKREGFVLPRVSALFKLTDKLSSRIGGGLGYKMPTVFTEQTEAMQYRNIFPLFNVTSEKSYGGTADLNYKIQISKNLFFSINQLFFYTLIDNPMVLQSDTSGNYIFANTNQAVNSSGFETNFKFIYKEHLKFFTGYTYTNALAKYLAGNQYLPLLPRNKLNLALVYEKENNFKTGLEGYFTDRQYLTNGTKTSSFWEFGAMAEKTFGKISVYINAENSTDTRQSRYKRVVNEPHNNPTFDDIWTHAEGFVISGGLKVKL